jgi:hypothetical protein
MLAKPLLSHILSNDSLTRGLGDAEARILVEWLVEQAEHLAHLSDADADVAQGVSSLCRRGRAIGRFVGLWCHENEPGSAAQLAATEQFAWPLPCAAVDPCELMHAILTYEATMN